jgi:dCMP deaminase
MAETLAANRSKDPSTQVGSIVVNYDRHIVSSGYNGFAPGVLENEERWQRPAKYDRVIHAETNAVIHATQSLKGCTLYTTHAPCLSCAKVIIAAGIVSVVVKQGTTTTGFNEEALRAQELLSEAGVGYRYVAA